MFDSPVYPSMRQARPERAREAIDLPLPAKSLSWPPRYTAAFRMLALTLVSYFALAAFPPVPPPPGAGLDASWVAALNMAHAQGLVAGKDWVFSFGPLGYLTVPEPESGDLALGLLYRVGISIVWCLILFVLAIRASSAAMGLWLVAVFGIVAVIDDYMYVDRLELTIAAMALLPIWRSTRWRYLELSLLALLASFALMVKFNIGMEALALFLTMLILTAWSDRHIWTSIRRQAFIPLVALIVSSIGFYVGATGQIGTFGSYLHHAWEIAGAYSESMGVIGPMWQAHLAVIAIAMPFVALWAIGDDPRRCLPAIMPAGVVTYFFFKHAFVRQHDSRFISLLAQLAIAMLFVAAFSQTRRDRKIIALTQILFILSSLQTSLALDPNRSYYLKLRFNLRAGRDLAPAYWRWEQTIIGLETAGNANLAKARLDDRFHRIIGRGTVDVAPWNIALVRANGWSWRPRPTFQPYVACRPSLDRLNAEHLESSRGADFIVLGWGEIDGRHQFLSDPRSWRAMLDWYDLALATNDSLLLRRRSTPRFAKPQEAGYTIARWNEEIVIPQDQPVILMSVDIQRTIYGKLTGLLFRNAPTYAAVTYRSGAKERWRAVAPNIEAGFPISPFARNLGDLVAIWNGQPPADYAASIHFEGDDLGQYEDALVVHWIQLPAAR
jgi:hypothetical protein